MQLTSTEIIKKLKKMFTPSELKIFCKIEAEKYKLYSEEEITEEPKYEAQFWANLEKEIKTNNNEDTLY